MAPLEAINIENSILGSIILDNTLAYKLDELSKDMFSVSYNKEIFEKAGIELKLDVRIQQHHFQIQFYHFCNNDKIELCFEHLDVMMKSDREGNNKRNCNGVSNARF